MESWVQSWRPRTNAFCDFSSPCLWSIAPATKKWCQVIRSAAPVTQNHLPKTEDLMLQNATPLRKSAPGPPNISDEHVSCTAPATENASLQILFKSPTPAIRFWNATKPFTFCSLLTRCTIPCACHAKRHLNVQKWFRTLSGLLTFWLGKFPSQGRALFRRNFQQRAVNFWYIFDSQLLRAKRVVVRVMVFCTFWLPNVLRATTACNFSSLIWPDGSAPAALASLLSTLRSHKSLEKHNVLRLFYLFAHLHLLSSDSFSSLIFSLLLFSSLLWLFPPLLFHLSILSEVWLLNFLRLCRCICIYIYISV